MANVEGLSNKELKAVILEDLKDVNIDPKSFTIKIKKGVTVTLKGEVDTRKERDLIIQTIMDVVGVEDIIDELVILRRFDSDTSEDAVEDGSGYDLFDEDNERMGTESVSRSVQDGVPYIPPMTSPFEETFENTKKKEPRKKKGSDDS